MAQLLAMILAGGRVGELDVLTFFRPKSVLPYGGLYRISDFPMSNLMHSDIENVGILSQYRPFDLISHIANGQPSCATPASYCCTNSDSAVDWRGG